MTKAATWDDEFDVVVIGSGSAALSAAMRLGQAGLSCNVLEKSDYFGGTTAMSGAGVWIPANHHAASAGLADSPEEALLYLRSASPAGWQETEDALWRTFAHTAPRALKFIETYSPLRFKLTHEPDVILDAPGGKRVGRMVSPRALSKWRLGRFARHLRRSTLPHLFTYHELYEGDVYHQPFLGGLKALPRLLWRVLARGRGQGSALVIGLLRGCLDQGCKLSLNTRARELIVESGRVAGVRVESRGQTQMLRAKRGVIVATGGFEWDDDLRNRHFPGQLDFIGSPRCNEGDGHRMVEQIGGQLARMDQANVHPVLPTRYEGSLHGLPMIFQAEPHAIVVDRNGRRFVNECDFNIGVSIDARDPSTDLPLHLPAWLIADQRFLKTAPPFLWYARRAPEWLRSSPTLAELAECIDVPEAALQKTVARFNEFCRRGKDDDFGRGERAWDRFKTGGGPEATLGTIEHGPFVAVPFNRSLLGTKGGARTNEAGQVLSVSGTVIDGLYAAGLAMANPIGTFALGPGTTIGPNLTWGFVCAEHIIASG